MKYSYFLFLLYFISSTVCAKDNGWVGEWKVNNKNKHMLLTISNIDKSHYAFTYNEGIGINGINFNGTVKPIESRVAFVDYLYRGKQCKLKLELSKNNKSLTLTGCELESSEESDKELIFVSHSQKLYFKAGFNCAKASTNIEVAICDSKVMAAADRKLGKIYKRLRKKLSAKNKKRLRTEQRQWIKARNRQCKKYSKEKLSYCLRRFYGKRLFALNLLHDYKIWQGNKLSYSVFQDVKKVNRQRKTKLAFHPMDIGLGLWLGGVMRHPLTDTGSFEVQVEYVNNSYILSGPYFSNPNEGFDPRSFGDNIFIEFTADNGIWVGLAADVNRLIYIPKDKDISKASEKFKSWMKNFDEPVIVNVF